MSEAAGSSGSTFGSGTHWNCFVAGCTANWRNWLECYWVPRRPEIKKFYQAFFKTDGINWSRRQRLCSRHWSTPRSSFKHLPDIRVPGESSKSKIAVRRRARLRACTVTTARRQRLVKKKEAKEQSHVEAINDLEVEVLEAREEESRKGEEAMTAQDKNNMLKKKVEALEERVKKLENLNKELKEKNSYLAKLIETRVFDSDTLTNEDLKYFTGLNKEPFMTLFRCFEPFLGQIRYESCRGSEDPRRKVTKRNELLGVLAVCRHALHLGVVAWMLGISESTMSRIFEAWIVFGDAVFEMIDIAPSHSLIKNLIPKAYKQRGFSHVTLILDATEFKITAFSDLNLNCLFFSDYKQTHTVKALVCLAPHGAITRIPDLYPGSISDTDITKITKSLESCLIHDAVLTDKGFAISELAATIGVEHNRPPMKDQDQFTEGQCDDTFKIASLRIHVERWIRIGHLRNYEILNSVWQCNRIDLLNSTWCFLANVLNIGMLVKPRE